MGTFIFPSFSDQHMFDNVYYMPVDKLTFKSIRIEILQLTGKSVEFKSITMPSKVFLHFRRVWIWYYKIVSSSSLSYILCLWILRAVLPSPGGSRQSRQHRTHLRGYTIFFIGAMESAGFWQGYGEWLDRSYGSVAGIWSERHCAPETII